jgi:Asp-tRNA(Asn)/Glu-tRNA(Gln) amidotransferase A subunit family amidase
MLNHLTLEQMASEIRNRKVSAIELLEAHMQQIERCNPQVNAFVMVFDAQARQEAESAEKRLDEGADIGPLHGVPVTVKDSFDIAGFPTTCGSKFFSNLPARHDAAAVRRLRRAGAIILAKTNTPEFLASYETDNYITGRTNNPWDPERTPGGSSGGEAAAISAFMSAGGIGSDGGGSIRMPAHFTGIAGLKPTTGRISAAGHVPEINHPVGLLGAVGPMARTASDVRLLFTALAGCDYSDPFSAPVPLRQPSMAGLRAGVMEQFSSVPVEPSIRAAVRKAATALESIGIPAEEFSADEIERAPNLWSFFFSELPARVTKELIAGREQDAHWTGTEFLARALEKPEPSSRRVLECFAERDRMRAAFLKQMESCPILLTPACGIAAFRHRQRRWPLPEKEIGIFEAMMPATAFNLLGLPGLSIPFGFAEGGLPVGVQLVARPWEEELLLDVAVRLEEARGAFPGPPGY